VKRSAPDAQEVNVSTPATNDSVVVDNKGLKDGALGLVSTVVVGVASTAPA
jgi:hypothetical protein